DVGVVRAVLRLRAVVDVGREATLNAATGEHEIHRIQSRGPRLVGDDLADLVADIGVEQRIGKRAGPGIWARVHNGAAEGGRVGGRPVAAGILRDDVVEGRAADVLEVARDQLLVARVAEA